MKNNMRPAVAVLALLAGPAARADEAPGVVNPGTPAPDCTLPSTTNRNAELPGYRSGPLCLPFMPTNQLIPPDRGPDFYITGFSDAAIHRRWATYQQDAACRAQALASAKPFISYEPRAVGQIEPPGLPSWATCGGRG